MLKSRKWPSSLRAPWLPLMAAPAAADDEADARPASLVSARSCACG
ncbi:hypothetical protein HBB16_11170 [Pseudonocardia sp. MCCB 268]|nr:hypothetical protein [Pseudonocardia cytotoxica]